MTIQHPIAKSVWMIPIVPKNYFLSSSMGRKSGEFSIKDVNYTRFAKKERKTSFVLPPFFGQILNEIKVVNQTEKKSFRFNRVSRIFVSFGKMPVDFISVCPRLCGRKVSGVSKQVTLLIHWLRSWGPGFEPRTGQDFLSYSFNRFEGRIWTLQRTSSNSWDKSALSRETSMVANTS